MCFLEKIQLSMCTLGRVESDAGDLSTSVGLPQWRRIGFPEKETDG